MAVLLSAIGVIMMYLFIIKPRLGKKEEKRMYLRTQYAHRGMHSDKVPENSLEAFRRCTDCGAELDVRLTRDGIPVVIHDSNTMRACGKAGKIDKLTLVELEEYSLADGSKVPTLKQALNVLGGRKTIVELKLQKSARRICKAVLAELEAGEGKYIVESFDLRVLIWFRIHAGDYIRCQLVAKAGIGGILARSLLMNFLTRPDIIAPKIGERASISQLICRKLWNVGEIWWTVDDENLKNRLLSQGDGVIFERKCD